MKRKIARIMFMLLSIVMLLWPVAVIADARQSTDRVTEPATRKAPEVKQTSATERKTTVKTSPESRQSPKKITTPKRDVSLKKISYLDVLKIKNAYMKDDNLHVVLQHLGREKLSFQDLAHTALIVSDGAKTNIINLRQKTTLLRQLAVPGKNVDFNTGIKATSRVVRVRIKGQRNFYTLKINIINMSPMKVPSKEMAVGSMPVKKVGIGNIPLPETPPEEMASGLTDALKELVHSKFWDVSVGRIEVTEWIPTYWQVPRTYSDKNPENEAILVNAGWPSINTNALKIKTFINFTTLPPYLITEADVIRWGSRSDAIKVKFFGAKGLKEMGSGKKDFELLTPHFSWEDVQAWNLDPSNKGVTFGNTSIETTLYWKFSEFEAELENQEVNYYGNVRAPVVVELDYVHTLEETNEENNKSTRPILVFSRESWPIKILSPARGDDWEIGRTRQIKWKSTGGFGRMKISLYKGASKLIGVVADNIIPPPPLPGSTTHTYNWRVGDYNVESTPTIQTANPGKYYWLKIDGHGEIGGPQPVASTWSSIFFSLHESKSERVGTDSKKQVIITPDSVSTPSAK